MRKSLSITLSFIALISLSCKTSVEDKENTNRDIYDVIVIGAGGGGLAAASQLARAGKRTLVIEQRDRVGGYMSSFKRKGYTFEAAHMAMDSLDKEGHATQLLEELGIADRIKHVKLDPMYRIIFPDRSVDIPADPVQYKKMLIKQYPHEREGIEKLFLDIKSVHECVKLVFPLNRGDYAGYAWRFLMNPFTFLPLIKYMNTPFPEMILDYVHDYKLLMTLCLYAGGIGNNPLNLSGPIFSGFLAAVHYGGYHYVLGGATSISEALAENIKKHGGKIILSNRVTKIILKNGRASAVETENGDTYRCRNIVSNANAPDTFFKLIGRENLPGDYAKKIESLEPANSAFVVYIGATHDYSNCFPDGTGQLFIVDETWNLAGNAWFYMEGIPEKIPYAIFNTSVVDPHAAPAGKNVIHIMTILPYDWRDAWHEKKDYSEYTELKNRVAGILVKRAEKYLPGLSSHIEVLEAASPRTMEHYTSNPGGSIYGWDNTVEQSHIYRLPQKTPIENIFLAGAWTYPGGGQSTVLRSGVLAAKLVLEND